MKNSSNFEKFLKSKNINNSSNMDFYKKRSMHNNIRFDGGFGQLDVFSKLFENRILMLTGIIDDYLCDLLKAQILYLESENDKDIKMFINSPGGDVYSGLGLLDVMDFVKPDICTINTGLAASMAAAILCSGKKGKRKALKRSRTMIHQPIGGGGWSQASDMEIDAREINSLKKELYELISENTGQNYERVHKDGDRDYWMTSKDALSYGMIDEIIIKRK